MKKVLCACLTVCMIFSLMACGAAQPEKAADDKKDAAQTTDEAAVEETDANANEEVSATDEAAPAEEAEDVEEADEEMEQGAPVAMDADLSLYEANTEVLHIVNDKAAEPNLDLIPISFAFGSSQLEDQGNESYSAENLYDGNLSTAYVEGVSGDGIGQLISIDLNNERNYEISMIRIYPGYQKDESAFKKNSRPSKLSFYFTDGHCFEQEFDYGNEAAGYFDIDLTKVFAGHVVSHRCIISIDDAVSGDKYDDCCISEIEFYSPKTVDEDVVLVKHHTEYTDSGETCQVKAIRNGETIWEHEGKTDMVTELDGAGYITTANGVVYVQDNWDIVALDENTGDVIWKSNLENDLSVSACMFDPVSGNVYFSGYYGPTLVGFDKAGNSINYKIDTESFWPCMLIPVIKGELLERIENVKIYFEGDSSVQTFEL